MKINTIDILPNIFGNTVREEKNNLEKVINEFKIIETDDGFRIEIKGDKEMCCWILNGFGFNNFFKTKPPFERGFHFGFRPNF